MNQQKWEKYSELFLDEFDASEENKKLEKIVGDKKIAAVIKYHLGSDYSNWLDSNIDALDGKKPKDCLTTESGRDSLKKVLMRFH